MKLTVDYCTECNHLDRAVSAAREILEKYPEEFDKVELVPSEGGVLRVSIDSEIVFDIAEDKFSIDEILENVKQNLEKE